ncbi:hypothetical protein [Sulfurimonas sp.]|uniref:hypothetical protein n=1 Tax=Sulfurimonas sp. TaxID=2022749 RepID=UPI003D14D740
MSIDDMFDDVQEKIKSLNVGILNPSNVPSHFTASQCNDMGFLSMELSSVIDDFNKSNKYESDLRKLSDEVDDIEYRAKRI